MSSKPRSDSVLKILPPDRRAAIADYAVTHSLEETVKWLREDSVKTSRSALSEFLSWQTLQTQLAENASTVETLLQEMAASNPDWTPEQVQSAGQSFFTALALQQRNPEVWVATQRLDLDRKSARTRAEFEQEKIKLRHQAEDRNERKLGFEREKFQRETCELFVKWSQDKRAKDIANSDSTNADKIEQLGQIMFGEDWKS